MTEGNRPGALTVPRGTSPPDLEDTREHVVPAAATDGSGATPGHDPRTRRRRRRWLYGGGVVVAAGAGLGIWLGTSGGAAAGPAATIKTVTVSVSTGTIKKTVSATGTIEPADDTALSFAVSGTVTAVNVSAGQDVTAGEVLATVTPAGLQADQSAAQAALTAAESTLSTDEDDDASTTQIASDKASVTSAEEKLTTAEKQVADASLTSPISGVVSSVDLTVGEQVGGGSAAGGASASTGSSSSEVTVVSDSSYIVKCSVDDTEVAEVKDADQAVITVTGATTTVYGTVGSVAEVATGSSTVASFSVVVDVTGTPSGLYAGASVTVSIIVKELSDVVEVPSGALSYSGATATATVVKSTGAHVKTTVTTGTTETGETEITKGLTVGDKIVEREVTITGVGGRSRTTTGNTGGTGGFPTGGSGGFPTGGSGGFPTGGSTRG